MADTQVAPSPPTGGGQAGGQQQQEGSSMFSVVKSMLFRGVMMYMVMSFFRRGTNNTPTAANTQGTGGPNVGSNIPATNLFENGTLMDLYVYMSASESFKAFNNSEHFVWSLTDLEYGDWYSGPNSDASYTHSINFETPEILKNNGSWYLHAYLVRGGKSPDPQSGKTRYSKRYTLHRTYQLNKYKKKSYKKTSNLLTGETEASTDEQNKLEAGIDTEIVSHWHPNITLNIVNDFTAWVPGQVPPPLDEFVEFTPTLQNYKPIFYVNNYWNLNKEYMPLNDTVDKLMLTVTFQPISMFKWQLYSAQQMRNKFNVLGNMLGEHEDEEDMDSMKEALLETNIYLLVLTVVVSIVHSIFEFLAFKNDIQFWNERKSLEGLSVRSVFFNVFQSLIVLLYVLDNETNTVIRISCLVGLAIEIWKINKVVDINIDRSQRMLMGLLPKVTLTDKGSYEESGTKEYDRMAFKYLGLALFPLGLGYCIYSVIYNEHKGWYSFILSSSYGFLLTFGFIMMTPQLFINYKLKSVAHLPWRMMTYKALNTFIDDIFAFVIKMPTMYRLGVFRDDIIFFIFLYQRYIYRVDPTRVNEFGYSGDMFDKKVDNKAVVDDTAKDNKEGNGVAKVEEKTKEEKKKD